MNRAYPKKVLSIAYCNFVWPRRKRQWRKEARVNDKVIIHGVQESLEPYYVPDKTEDDDFEVFVYDKTHLGSNLRKCLCLDRVKGVSKVAWEAVSKTSPHILHPTLLEVNEEGKIVDQMKERLARNMVSEEVEMLMRTYGNTKEADFCKVVREGLFEADDNPGISATNRCNMRMNLIKWLSDGVDHGDFPPYGSTIKGFSSILYEGLRTSNEAKLYLYALAKKGTYCVRSPSTLCSESFFSSMQEMDPWGQGVLTSEGVEKHISDFTTITALKMKDDRSFLMRTKRDTAYPLQTLDTSSKLGEETINEVPDNLPECTCRTDRFIRCIVPRNHFFDTKERARNQKTTKKPYTFSDINQPAR